MNVYETELRKWPDMPVDYTCGCGLYVHPASPYVNAAAIHIDDCPYARVRDHRGQGMTIGLANIRSDVAWALLDAVTRPHHPMKLEYALRTINDIRDGMDKVYATPEIRLLTIGICCSAPYHLTPAEANAVLDRLYTPWNG